MRQCFVLAALLAFALSLSAQTLPADADTTLLLRFDGNLVGVQGETPASANATGVAYVPGVFGQAIQLTAGNQISFAAANNISASAGTLEFWIKPNWTGTSTVNKFLLSWGTAGGLLFGKDASPNWRAIFNRTLVEQGVAVNANTFPANQWRHAAFTWEGTAIRIYLDGVQVNQTTLTSALPAIAAANFVLGSDNFANPIDAAIDELRISSRARTATEINASYNRARPGIFGKISTFAGNGVGGFGGDNGPATNALLLAAEGVATDASGNVYVADTANQRIRRIDSNGNIATIAGVGAQGDPLEGVLATESPLRSPVDVMVDPTGNIYIADGNARIRRVDAVTRVIRTVAGGGGGGVAGFSGDGGLATVAQISQPRGMVIDAAGNLLFVDTDNNRVRRVTPAGVITTIAGTGARTSTGDGGLATAATLAFPQNLAIRPDGTILVSEYESNRVRSISPLGIITNFAGPGGCPTVGDGGPATAACIAGPRGVAIDSVGNTYISERISSRIRKVGPDGIITTIAGISIPTPGFSGDGGLASLAQINSPTGLALEKNGNIIISDTYNYRVRRITNAAPNITGLSPDSALLNSPSFELIVAGTGFDGPGSVFWNDVPVGTYIGTQNSDSVTVTIPANLLAIPGPVLISARNNGQLAGPGLSFNLSGSVLTPSLVAAAPDWGYGDVLNPTRLLFIEGSQIQPNATAAWNGLLMEADAITSGTKNVAQLLVTIPAGLTQVAGPVAVTVKNPGGTPSAPLTFNIPPPRTVNFATPNVVPVNTAFPLVLNGTNFDAQDYIHLLRPNSSPFTGTIERLSSTQLRLAVPATAVPVVGTYQAWLGYTAPAANRLGFYANPPLSFIVAPPGTCGYDLFPSAATLPVTAAVGSVTLAAPPGCAWAATSPVPWIAFSSVAAGSGPANITFNVQANNTTAARSALLTIGGQPFSVNQSGPVCQFGLTASATAATAAGLSGTVAVGASNNLCAWTSSSSAPWLRLTSPSAGNGNASLSFVADPNPSSAGRSATVTVSDQTLAFTQAGFAPCTFVLSQSTQSTSFATANFSIDVTANAGCAWTASSPVPWVSIPSGASASGKGVVAISVLANPTSASRSASLTIAGQPFVVTQAGATATAACTFSANPTTVAAEGRTELLGDLFLTCTALPASLVADLELTLNSNVTNGADLPALSINNGPPTLAQLTGYNSVRWPAVRPPAGTVTFRFSNLRADASLIAPTATLASALLTAGLRFNATYPIPVANPLVTAAIVLPGLSLQQGAPLTTSNANLRSVPILFREGFGTAFRAGADVTAPTRLVLTLRNVPAGVKIFAPTFPFEGPGKAQLISADPSGLGGFPIIGTGFAGGVSQELVPVSGTVTAVWQLLSADPLLVETLTFPLLIQGASDPQFMALLPFLSGGFGPFSAVSVARGNAPVPRYREPASVQRRINLRLSTILSPTPASSSAKTQGQRALFTVNAPVAIAATVANETEVASNNTQIRNNLPTGLVFRSCSVPCTESNGQITIPLGNIPPGESRSAVINATVGPTLGDGVTVSNWATTDSDDPTADLAAASSSTSVGISVAPPSISLPLPISGSGLTKSFVLQFSNPTGFTRLGVLNALINNALDGGNACYIAYSVPAGVLFLVNDPGPGDGLSAPLVLGTANSVSNGQCTVNGAGSSAVGSGNSFTLTLNITFKSTFTGSKIVYLAARDDQGLNSGWSSSGFHLVPGGAATFPNPAAMTPPAGNSSGGIITFDYNDQTSNANLQTLWALVNTALDGRNACYIVYYAPGNLIGLYPDNGDPSTINFIPLSGNATLSNSQCQLNTSGSTVIRTGTRLSLNLNLAFKPAFAGSKVVWMALQTLTAVTSPWKANGAWQVPP